LQCIRFRKCSNWPILAWNL